MRRPEAPPLGATSPRYARAVYESYSEPRPAAPPPPPTRYQKPPRWVAKLEARPTPAVGPNALTTHKERLLLVWRSGQALGVAPPTSTAGRTILGDPEGIARYLRSEVTEARLTLYRLEWLEHGGAWWDEFIEGPVDDELLKLMRERIPREASESDEAYDRRLWCIISSLRVRLGDVRAGSKRHKLGGED